jgi:hypothetical protein
MQGNQQGGMTLPMSVSPKANDNKNGSQSIERSNPFLQKRMRKRILYLCNHIVHTSSSTLSKVLRGDVAPIVPADLYGQTLAQEIAECPFRNENLWLYSDPSSSLSFHKVDVSSNISVKQNKLDEDWDNLHHRKLYGGAQYHRALSQFDFLIHSVPVDQSTSDEIALLLYGISDVSHNGNDLLRSVAKLSSVKIESIMSSILDDMVRRIEYVLLRMWDVVEYTLLVREDTATVLPTTPSYSGKRGFVGDDFEYEQERDIEAQLLRHAKTVFEKFVLEKCQFCYNMVREDLKALFRFVSWDLAFGDRFLSTIGVDGCIVKIEGIDDDTCSDDQHEHNGGSGDGNTSEKRDSRLGDKTSKSRSVISKSSKILDPRTDEILRNVVEAVQLTAGRIGTGGTMPQTCAAINVLIRYVTDSWRRDVSQLLMTKFNAYCMLPLHEEFLGYLRYEMNKFVDTINS